MTSTNLRIWINRAGPSRIHAMAMLRNNPDGKPVTIHATRTRPDNPSLKFADVAGSEPGSETTDKEYGQFAVDYVKKHKIEVIIPTARMAALADRAAELLELGCVLLAPDAGVCRITDSKYATYRAAEEAGLDIPPVYRAKTVSGFYAAVATFREMGHTVTVKPDTGWAASGFRILTSDVLTLDDLSSGKPYIPVATYASAISAAARSGEPMPDLLVMPYMDNPEVSVDMLCSDGEPLITVPRTKNGFYREFSAPQEIIEQAHTLARALKLDHLVNVQFRYLDGKPVLLEINPRPSAGTFHTEATGVNLYWEAVKCAVYPAYRKPPVPKLGGRVLIQEYAVGI